MLHSLQYCKTLNISTMVERDGRDLTPVQNETNVTLQLFLMLAISVHVNRMK